MSRGPAAHGPGGLLLVDKPAGMTSHDVVARVRKLARTRRVGHAGTLDPMATGLLIVGVERATRLLGYLSGRDKCYLATVRLGVSTDSDDATGEVLMQADAGGIGAAELRVAVAALTGEILQVPSSISAVKVAGERAYRRVRAGEEVELAARPVTISRFFVGEPRREGATLDVDVEVTCSTGTYVRALARDLGAALGVGGHLTSLRRTSVGPFGIEAARTLVDLATDPVLLPLREAAAAAFPRRDLDEEAARIVVNGGWIPAAPDPTTWPVAAFAPDGEFVALLEDRDDRSWPVAVFTSSVIPSVNTLNRLG